MAEERGRLDVHHLSGCKLGKYEVGKKLGEGGMAVVYQAVHLDFQVPVALKFLLPDLVREDRTRRRFRNEARLLFKLKHPNLVRVIELVEEGGLLGMAMDYVEGDDLSVVLKARLQPLSAAEIQEIFLPVLGAVGYAHSQGILHRDLKPSNLLLEKKGGRWNPQVVDFGVAKSFEEESLKTKTGVILGTPLYCSPEQIQGMRGLDARCDVYALGCTLYELLTLRTPYADKGGILQILFAHLYEPIPSLCPFYPKEGAALDRLFEKALAKDRSKRFASCEAFASEMATLFSSLPVPLGLQAPFVPPLSLAPRVESQGEDSGEEKTALESVPSKTPPADQLQELSSLDEIDLPVTPFPEPSLSLEAEEEQEPLLVEIPSPTLQEALGAAENESPATQESLGAAENESPATQEALGAEESEEESNALPSSAAQEERLPSPEEEAPFVEEPLSAWEMSGFGPMSSVRSAWTSASVIYGEQKHSLFFRASVAVFLVGLLMVIGLIIFFHAQKPAPLFAPPQVPRRVLASPQQPRSDPLPPRSLVTPPVRMQPSLAKPLLPPEPPPPTKGPAAPLSAPVTKRPPPPRRPAKRPPARLFEIDDPL